MIILSKNQSVLSPVAICVRILLHHLFRLFVIVDVQGNLSAFTSVASGQVIITNHLHRIDFLVVQSVLPKPTFFVLAYDVSPGKPIISMLIRCLAVLLGGIVVYRNGESNKLAVQAMLGKLAAGQAVLLAPEGDKIRTGILGKGKTGAALLAMKSQVPVVPVATYGYEQLDFSFRRWRRPVVYMRVGNPIYLSSSVDPSPEDLRKATDYLMFQLAELLPITMRGEYIE